jgi:outer membrane murein-binding lipoprotein Lpp
MNSPIHKIVLAAIILATSLRAGSAPDKAVASIASDHAIYEGSINLGFKTNDV